MIVLCTSDGEYFLDEQLASIETQSYRNWRLVMSDDASDDRTLAILEAWRDRLGESRVEIRHGPNCGFVANFLAVACDPALRADYFAFTDQDDIWEPDKLDRAVRWLATQSDVPALYGSRTRLIDARGRETGFSPLFAKPPAFANALVQNVAGGNTMVFNAAARRLLMLGGVVDVAAHDWWLYLIVTACGGTVFYDRVPRVRYRQHGANLVGANANNWAARIKRMRLLLAGRFREWNSGNLRALSTLSPYMTPPSRATFDAFVTARDAGFWARLNGIRRSGVYRQTLLGNLGLMAATLLKKL